MKERKPDEWDALLERNTYLVYIESNSMGVAIPVITSCDDFLATHTYSDDFLATHTYSGDLTLPNPLGEEVSILIREIKKALYKS